MPNKIEGTIICQNAKKSLEEIDTYVDSLCVINDIENASTNNKDEKKSLFEATNTTIKNLIHTLSEFVIVSDYRKSNFADLVNFINNNKYFSFFYFNNENIEEKVLKNKDLFSNEKTSNATNILVDFEFSRDENQILIFDQFKNFFCNNFRNIATLIKKITVTSFEEKKYIGIFYSINNLQLENNLDNGTIINLQQNVDNKRISCVDFDINSKNCIEEFIEKNKLKKNTIKIDDFFKAENNK
jgi:hypothetical protein